jgi:hypothetical protein
LEDRLKPVLSLSKGRNYERSRHTLPAKTRIAAEPAAIPVCGPALEALEPLLLSFGKASEAAISAILRRRKSERRTGCAARCVAASVKAA